MNAARDAIARNPRSDFAYGVLADALTELGRYPEAVQAVEEMMRIRPGGGAYSRAAHLRALHGDRPGAVRLMEMSLEATSASDPEAYAWMLVMLGREHQAMGGHRSAHRSYSRALAAAHLADLLAAAGERRRAAAPSTPTWSGWPPRGIPRASSLAGSRGSTPTTAGSWTRPSTS